MKQHKYNIELTSGEINWLVHCIILAHGTELTPWEEKIYKKLFKYRQKALPNLIDKLTKFINYK